MKLPIFMMIVKDGMILLNLELNHLFNRDFDSLDLINIINKIINNELFKGCLIFTLKIRCTNNN